MDNYIYVPGLSESVEQEVKKEKAEEAKKEKPKTSKAKISGALQKEVTVNDRGADRRKKVDDRSITVPVWEKYALTIHEASDYFGLTESKLKSFEYKRQLEEGFNESDIDGYSGFVFKFRCNTVLSPHEINRVIDRISAHTILDIPSVLASARMKQI